MRVFGARFQRRERGGSEIELGVRKILFVLIARTGTTKDNLILQEAHSFAGAR